MLKDFPELLDNPTPRGHVETASTTSKVNRLPGADPGG